ncbi:MULTISPECIES: hypothetical protein [Hyphomonas]|jgi:hypothetical protein
MTPKFFPVALIALLIGASPALADDPLAEGTGGEANAPECELRISPPSTLTYRGPFSRGYDTGSSHAHAELASVKILHDGDTCQYFLRIEPDTGPGEARLVAGNGQLTYHIEQRGGQGRSANNVIELPGSFSRNQPQTEVPFQVSLPTGQSARAGVYSGRMALSLYRTDNGAEELVDQQSLYLTSNVAPKVSASFGDVATGNNQSADLNLGMMTRHQKASLDFAVSANTDYKVNLESQNAGALKHEFSDNVLDYDIRIDGQLLRDSDPNSATLFTSNENSRHRLDFELRDDPTLGVAGKYSDRLTLIISAQ